MWAHLGTGMRCVSTFLMPLTSTSFSFSSSFVKVIYLQYFIWRSLSPCVVSSLLSELLVMLFITPGKERANEWLCHAMPYHIIRRIMSLYVLTEEQPPLDRSLLVVSSLQLMPALIHCYNSNPFCLHFGFILLQSFRLLILSSLLCCRWVCMPAKFMYSAAHLFCLTSYSFSAYMLLRQ